jgi:thiamine biosynthesis protein ThiS
MKNFRSTQFNTWLIINSKVYVINYKIEIHDLLYFLKYTNPALVTEHNLKIVSKSEEKNRKVKSLDKIELVTIVGGG